MSNTITNFEVKVYGTITPYSSTISRARVRIFYTGVNRNATYISEEFADKLLSTIPYAPIKGIFDEEARDFTGHGDKRSAGKIYGIVPENPNISWEDHLDEDGNLRKYACADVFLFTAIYPEATEIIGKSQSMEIYSPSIVGKWELVESQKLFVYREGSFLGLQVLGKKVTPCFEGAEFFTLYDNLKKLIDNLGGGQEMTVNFKLSENEDYQKLFSLINNTWSEEHNWEANYGIYYISTDFALCYDYEKNEFFRQLFQKDDTNQIILGDRINFSILEVSEQELQALDLLKVANNNSFIDVDKVYSVASEKIRELTEEKEAITTSLNELKTQYELVVTEQQDKEAEIATLKETYEVAIQEKDVALNFLAEENNALKQFKQEKETQERKDIIAKYSKLLDPETLAPYIADTTSNVFTLEKELAYLLVQKNPNIFTNKESESENVIPNLEDNRSDVVRILAQTKNRKNKK